MITPEGILQYKRRKDRLKGDRGTWETHWRELAQYISPRKSDFASTLTPGDKNRVQIYDAVGEQSNALLVAGLHGMMTNPASKWFALQASDDETNAALSVKSWLREVELMIWNKLYSPGSNFAVALNECYEDLGAFGTHIMFMTQDDTGDLLFQPQHLARTYIATNAKGVVDTVYRQPEFTVRTLVEEFGINGVSAKIREAYGEPTKQDEPVEVTHVVAPRAQYDKTKRDPGNMPWVSCYFEDATMHKLEESGFADFPFACPRWSKRPGEIYGRGPGMMALPDIKMVNAMMLTVIKAAQKAVDPPLVVPDDGFFGPLRTVPGGLNYGRGQREIYQLPTSSALPFALDMIEQLRDRIRSMFHADVMQLVSDREMTLGEAQMRFTERMRLLGPVHGRLDNELLSRVIEWTYGQLERSKLLPPAPEELDGSKLRVEYISPVSVSQRQTESQGLTQLLQVAMPLLEADPALFAREFSPERTLGWLADLFKVNPDVRLTDEEKQAAAEAAQAQQQAAMAAPAADAMQKGAGAVKSLADAHAGGGVDMGALVGETVNQLRIGQR